MHTDYPIVVGIDGSSADQTALRWAVSEAQTRKTWLRVVHAFRKRSGPATDSSYRDVPVVDTDEFYAEKLLVKAVREVARIDPNLHVQPVAREGAAVPVFVAESARASLVVLYSRRLTSRLSALLRSTGSGTLARAACPALAVREGSAIADGAAAAVVGVDCTSHSEAALEFGFDYASRHNVQLRAVRCWQPYRLSAMAPHSRMSRSDVEMELSEMLAVWSDKFPEVSVSGKVVHDHPIAGLVAEAENSQLLVVGCRGHSAFAGSLLRSVSQGVLHHADCPVAVVPSA